MVGEQVKSNLRDRVEAVKIIPDNAVAATSIFVDRLSQLKPVQAVTGMAAELGDGVLKFFEKQCEITRRWGSQVSRVL